MIHQLYEFIFQRVDEMNGELQLIIVDHAVLQNEQFSNSVIDDWHSGDNLIPVGWYVNDDLDSDEDSTVTQ